MSELLLQASRQTIAAVLVLLLASAVYTDLKTGKIPNALTFGAAAFGLAANTLVGVVNGTPWQGLATGALGWLAGVGIFLVPYVMGGLGAGDVKLLAALGALKGPAFVLFAAFGTAVAGGLIALGLLLYRRQLGLALVRAARSRALPTLSDQRTISFPYALAIAVGGLLALAVG